MAFKKAERHSVKIKIAITGPSGYGKTYSALRLASGLGKKIALIDTENRSSEMYADKFNFDSDNIDPPYTVEKYIEKIDEAVKAGYEVLVIDSLSHAWSGEGGILQRVEQVSAASKSGNSYMAWGKVTPLQEKFISKILHSPIHLIATMRSKQAYEVEDSNGKKVPKKIGLAPIQRDGVEYEFSTVFDVSQNHEATVSKDRTGLFVDKIFQINENTGKEILDWVSSGKQDVVNYQKEIIAFIVRLGKKENMDLCLREISDALGEEKTIDSRFILALDNEKAKLIFENLGGLR